MLPEERYIVGEEREALPKLIPKVVSGMHGCIAAMASSGNNVIVDHVLQHQQWLKECVDLLADFRVLFVGVRCSLEELERRERERGDVQKGLARWQFDRVHAHGIYDFEVDSSICSPMQCALQIKDALQDSHSPNAFNQIKNMLNTAPQHKGLCHRHPNACTPQPLRLGQCTFPVPTIDDQSHARERCCPSTSAPRR